MQKNTNINYVVCENLRSAYNVGNIIRTADALGRGVIIAGYSAPAHHKKVEKTALGAEKNIHILQFTDIKDSIARLQENNYLTVAAELNENSKSLNSFQKSTADQPIGLIMGNELLGVDKGTLEKVDYTLHIPMQGIKESLNVGQAAAIFMRELGR